MIASEISAMPSLLGDGLQLIHISVMSPSLTATIRRLNLSSGKQPPVLRV